MKMKTTGNFGILLCFCMMLFSCKGAEQKDRQQGMVVRVTQAVKPSEGDQKEFSFISKPFRTSELSFRVGGRSSGLRCMPERIINGVR